MSLTVKQLAPDFTLNDQSGVAHTLSDYQGQWVLLYFYPKDDTPGCITEACSFQDNLPVLTDIDAVVFGISADDERSHKKFADKYNLSFPLLADSDHSVCELYDVWKPKKIFGKEIIGIVRSSFLIDPEGSIAKIYPNVKPKKHVEEVLGDLRIFQNL